MANRLLKILVDKGNEAAKTAWATCGDMLHGQVMPPMLTSP
ncbi:MAG: hypothetical protein ACLTDR_15320 [Adlercreutzia equolifaciens]